MLNPNYPENGNLLIWEVFQGEKLHWVCPCFESDFQQQKMKNYFQICTLEYRRWFHAETNFCKVVKNTKERRFVTCQTRKFRKRKQTINNNLNIHIINSMNLIKRCTSNTERSWLFSKDLQLVSVPWASQYGKKTNSEILRIQRTIFPCRNNNQYLPLSFPQKIVPYDIRVETISLFRQTSLWKHA